MTVEVFQNFVSSALAGSITSGATSLAVTPGTGGTLAQPAAGQLGRIIITDLATGLLHEIITYTSVSGDTVSGLTRGAEGTVAQAWNANDLIISGPTKGTLQQFVQAAQAQSCAATYAPDTGTANAYVIAPSPAIVGTPTDGTRLFFKAANANTTASTLTVNGVSNPLTAGGGALQGGEIVANGMAAVVWNSSGTPGWQLEWCIGGSPSIPNATQSHHAVAYGQAGALISTSRVPVRQTVLTGVADANGYATFLQIGTGLSVNLLATASQLVLAFAAGFGANGEADYVGQITADVASAWSGLPANTTSYLYVDRNPTTSVLTYGASSLTPAYQDAAPGSPATDQHWFSPLTMVMQRWNGSAWAAVQRVFVGRAVAGASTIVGVTNYAFKGKYLSQPFALAYSASTTVTHALGLIPRLAQSYLVNVISELGYGVGNRVLLPYADNTTSVFSLSADTLNGSWNLGSGGLALPTVNTGTRAPITTANWNGQMFFDRGW